MSDLNLDLSWLPPFCLPSFDLEAMPGDASRRRFFRLKTKFGQSWILMQSEGLEAQSTFLKAGDLLAALGCRVPRLKGCSEKEALMLVDDLGEATYLDKLSSDDSGNLADVLYQEAFQPLLALAGIDLQTESARMWPRMDEALLWQQHGIFEQWYLIKHLGLSSKDEVLMQFRAAYKELVSFLLQLPFVLSHMDYHARNLIYQPGKPTGIVDFQDLMYAPITYDLVSLLKDCYISWPRQRVLEWSLRFRDRLDRVGHLSGLRNLLDKDWISWLDGVGLQRHLKVLGIFARLHYKEGKSRYLNDLPRVLHYIQEVLCWYPEWAPFKAAFAAIRGELLCV